MIQVTVRCGCTRAMLPDTHSGPGRYRCSCGARIAISGLPKYDAEHCSRHLGNGRICNGPKVPDAAVCQPCSLMIARLALRDPEMATELGTAEGRTDYIAAHAAEMARRREQDRVELAAYDQREDLRKVCVVYYCELRPGVVKIGTTTQLGTRVDSFRLPASAVLAAEPGYFKLENLRHRQFADLRITPQREDFRFGDALRDHVSKVAGIHGDPVRTGDTHPGYAGRTCARSQLRDTLRQCGERWVASPPQSDNAAPLPSGAIAVSGAGVTMALVLYIIGFVLLVLAAFGVGISRVSLGWLGLAFIAFTATLLPHLT